MKSQTLPSFWECYKPLPDSIKKSARKAYRLWVDRPFHPSLHFKCVNQDNAVWSLRVTLSCRVLGLMQDDTIVWFWIGSHDDYERLL